MYHFVDSVFFAVLYPTLLVGSVITGYYIAEKKYRQKNKEWKASGVEAAVIGIFGLLLSFTFLSSGNAIRERGANVHTESDCVADLRRQSLFLSDTLKQLTKTYLLEYLGEQIDFCNRYRKNEEGLEDSVSAANGIYLTGLTTYAAISKVHHEETQKLLPYFNKLNNLFYRNLYSFKERVPLLVLFLLISGSLLIGILVGFMNGFHHSKHYLVPLIFVVLVALCINTILDMNNPTSGSIRPSYDDFKYQKEILEKSTR